MTRPSTVQYLLAALGAAGASAPASVLPVGDGTHAAGRGGGARRALPRDRRAAVDALRREPRPQRPRGAHSRTRRAGRLRDQSQSSVGRDRRARPTTSARRRDPVGRAGGWRGRGGALVRRRPRAAGGGRTSLRDDVAFVASIGGHDDLYRVLRFLATDVLTHARAGMVHAHAHDYGLVVFFYALAERFVEPDQVLVFRDALRLQLQEKRAEAVRVAGFLTRRRAGALRPARGPRQARPPGRWIATGAARSCATPWGSARPRGTSPACRCPCSSCMAPTTT